MEKILLARNILHLIIAVIILMWFLFTAYMAVYGVSRMCKMRYGAQFQGRYSFGAAYCVGPHGTIRLL